MEDEGSRDPDRKKPPVCSAELLTLSAARVLPARSLSSNNLFATNDPGDLAKTLYFAVSCQVLGLKVNQRSDKGLSLPSKPLCPMLEDKLQSQATTGYRHSRQNKKIAAQRNQYCVCSPALAVSPHACLNEPLVRITFTRSR